MLIRAPIGGRSAAAALGSFDRRLRRFLPPTGVREIVGRRGLTAFKPERHQISVLFVDIEGYTRLAEQMLPERLVAMTEVILTRLTHCVYDTAGTLGKNIGEYMIAFWRAPCRQAGHAGRALDCARAEY